MNYRLTNTQSQLHYRSTTTQPPLNHRSTTIQPPLCAQVNYRSARVLRGTGDGCYNIEYEDDGEQQQGVPIQEIGLLGKPLQAW